MPPAKGTKRKRGKNKEVTPKEPIQKATVRKQIKKVAAPKIIKIIPVGTRKSKRLQGIPPSEPTVKKNKIEDISIEGTAAAPNWSSDEAESKPPSPVSNIDDSDDELKRLNWSSDDFDSDPRAEEAFVLQTIQAGSGSLVG